jgi:GntP family gluconate:H+ symporter
VLVIVVSTSKFKIHPFLALIFTAILFGLFSGMPLDKIVESINLGFGGTIGQIGIVIIAGVMIGTFLEHTGGAYAMANRILRITGKKKVPLTMSIIGYIVSIPVFADAGFVILMPLNKALSKQANISLAGTSVALALGLMTTHCLVPPTPGPIAAAGILEADLGLVIILGIAVSVFTMAVGWLYATKIAARHFIDPNPELSESALEEKLKQAPRAMKAFLPIVVPIILIVLRSISDFPTEPFGNGQLKDILGFIGNPVIALLIGLLLAFTLPRKFDRNMLSTTGWIGQSLINAALIVMITGAGGAFGMILRNSEIAAVLGDYLVDARIGILLPFIISTALRIAQGSSTVALITTASLMVPLMEPLGLDSGIARALVVLAIGAGSMVASHTNDSLFWIFTQMTGMDVKTGLRIHTVGTVVIGFASALVIWGISLFLI